MSLARRGLVVVALLLASLGCRADDGAGLDDGAGTEESAGDTGTEDIAGRCTMSEAGSPWDDDGLWAHMSELALGCAWKCPPDYAYQSAEPVADESEWSSWAADLSDEPTITALVLGDPGTWTLDPELQPEAPTRLATAALDACAGECDLGLVLGDGFYSHDVVDTSSPYWGRWRAALEPFCDPSCDADNRFHFWATVGNHDYFPPSEDGEGNALPGNLVAAQIAYTDDPANAGHLWMMPERAYAVPGLPAWLGIWVMDTVAVVERDKWSFEGQGGEIAQAQLDEVAAGMAAAAPDSWKILAGHHPALTVGSREDAAQSHPEFRCQSYFEVSAMRELAAELTTHLHLLISGHEHNQQLHPGAGYLQVVSGNAGKFSTADLDPDEPGIIKHESELGFVIVEFTPEQASLQFYGVAEGSDEAVPVGELQSYSQAEIADLSQALAPLLE